MKTMTQPRIRDLKSEKELASLAEGDVVLIKEGDRIERARYAGIQKYEDDLSFITLISLISGREIPCGNHPYEDRFVFHIRRNKGEIRQIKAKRINLSLSSESYLDISSDSIFTFYKTGRYSPFYSVFDKQLSEAGI